MFFIVQALLLAALCAVAVGLRYARSKRRPGARDLGIDLAGIVGVVLVFGMLTGGRGCAYLGNVQDDCQPSPQGYICRE